MKKIIVQNYIDFIETPSIALHLIASLIFFVLSMVITYYAASYTDGFSEGNVVPDLLLDHLPILKVGYLFFQGAVAVVVALILVLLYNPKYIPFTFECTALFFLIRSIFMVMTHLSAPSVESYSFITHEHHVKETLFTVSSGNDLFFSGHAGFPYLLALIFWSNKHLRYFFLLCSLIGAGAVIMGHLHYSIDVFSAYFITFGIFEIAKRLFAKEFRFTPEQTLPLSQIV